MYLYFAIASNTCLCLFIARSLCSISEYADGAFGSPAIMLASFIVSSFGVLLK